MWPTLFTVAAVLLAMCLVLLILAQRSRVALQLKLGEAGVAFENLREAHHKLGHDHTRATLALESSASLGSERDKLRQENTDLVRRVERLGSERDALTDLHKKIDATLDGVATRSLKESGEVFLARAKEVFEREQDKASAALETRKVAIDAMLKPINDGLTRTHKVVEELRLSGQQTYGGVQQHLLTLLEDQKRLRDETANLVKALRRPEVRGQWGEMQLRRVAELAGMAAYCDFTEQNSVRSDGSGSGGGGLRPDMVVTLPGGREIVVDAKTPITAFIDAAECTDDADRDTCLARHVKHIEDKVAELSSKRYQDHFRTADFVVLFIPGESFLYAAAQRKPELIETAMNRNVVIATPTTLISLLKVVALGWREEQLAENAMKIRDLGQELHKRVATLSKHLDNLGKAVGKTVEHYNKFVAATTRRCWCRPAASRTSGPTRPRNSPPKGASRWSTPHRGRLPPSPKRTRIAPQRNS